MSFRRSVRVRRYVSAVDLRSWIVAAALGGLAYITGFIVTAIGTGVAAEVGESFTVASAGTVAIVGHAPDGLIEAAGWAYYGAHFVGYSEGYHFAFGEGSYLYMDGSFNYLLEAPMETPSVGLLAVPILVLFLAGGLAVRLLNHQASIIRGFTTGSKVAAGYGLLSILGIFAFTIPVIDGPAVPRGDPVDATPSPNVAETLLLMVVLYPAVFGGLGGALGAVWRSG